MKQKLRPYLLGSFIGLLISMVIIILNRNLGNSNALVSFAGFIKSFFVSSKSFESSTYYKTYMIDRPIFEIQFATIIGIILGSFISARLNKDKIEIIPTVWKRTFGTSKIKRIIGAITGGILVGLGSRIADGCMSGLGLSSGIKLATVAWIFMAAVFIAAILTSNVIYKRGN